MPVRFTAHTIARAKVNKLGAVCLFDQQMGPVGGLEHRELKNEANVKPDVSFVIKHTVRLKNRQFFLLINTTSANKQHMCQLPMMRGAQPCPCCSVIRFGCWSARPRVSWPSYVRMVLLYVYATCTSFLIVRKKQKKIRRRLLGRIVSPTSS